VLLECGVRRGLQHAHACDCVRMHADCVFSGFAGTYSVLRFWDNAAGALQNVRFHNVSLRTNLIDVSYGGGVAMASVFLDGVKVREDKLVGTLEDDGDEFYNACTGEYISYDYGEGQVVVPAVALPPVPVHAARPFGAADYVVKATKVEDYSDYLDYLPLPGDPACAKPGVDRPQLLFAAADDAWLLALRRVRARGRTAPHACGGGVCRAATPRGVCRSCRSLWPQARR
jgi:hypothetical protein